MSIHGLSDIAVQRFRNQQLLHQQHKTPDALVRWCGAIQAQEYLHALWAVGQRVQGAKSTDIETAIAERKIVRTWPMRGTVHFVPAEDVHWMLKLFAPRVVHATRSVYAKAGVDEATLAQSRKALVKALRGTALTRKEVYTVLDDAGVAATAATAVGSRGLHIIVRLAMDGVLCFGPRQGKQPSYVLLDEWVPRPRKLNREEGLAELALRYYQSHGPATERDFAWWAGLTLGDARIAIACTTPTLDREHVDGQTYFFAGWHKVAGSGHVHLLPMFDEFTVAYERRDILLHPEYAAQLNGRPNGALSPVIVCDGQIIGTWQREFQPNAVAVTTSCLVRQDASMRNAVAEAVSRFGAFVNAKTIHQTDAGN